MEGNRGHPFLLVVVVDNTLPSLGLSAPYRSFSPNGDGNRDILPISQSRATREETWTGEIRDSWGRAIKRLSWEGEARDFTRDEKDESDDSVWTGS
jgi:hypothetical protein